MFKRLRHRLKHSLGGRQIWIWLIMIAIVLLTMYFLEAGQQAHSFSSSSAAAGGASGGNKAAAANSLFNFSGGKSKSNAASGGLINSIGGNLIDSIKIDTPDGKKMTIGELKKKYGNMSPAELKQRYNALSP